MFRPTNIIIGILTVTVLGFGIALFTRSTPVVEQAAAEWSPEAKALAESIARNVAEYEQGAKMVNEGSALMNKSAAAAKGKDLVLCADFQARFDRATKQLVPDASCPFL